MEYHGWTKYYNVDLLDATGPDLEVDIPNGKIIKKNYFGKNIKKYDSMLVLSHFKEHPMGGYGGRFRQWVFSNEPLPYNSFGNGSSMRV